MTAAKNNEITGLPTMFIFTTFDVDKETLNGWRLFQRCFIGVSRDNGWWARRCYTIPALLPEIRGSMFCRGCSFFTTFDVL
jgi:hypothetical protein